MSVARDMRDDGAGTHLSIGMSLVGSIEARRELERLPRGEWWSRMDGLRFSMAASSLCAAVRRLGGLGWWRSKCKGIGGRL